MDESIATDVNDINNNHINNNDINHNDINNSKDFISVLESAMALRRQHLAQIRAVGGDYDALARQLNIREKDAKYAITLGT